MLNTLKLDSVLSTFSSSNQSYLLIALVSDSPAHTIWQYKSAGKSAIRSDVPDCNFHAQIDGARRRNQYEGLVRLLDRAQCQLQLANAFALAYLTAGEGTTTFRCGLSISECTMCIAIPPSQLSTFVAVLVEDEYLVIDSATRQVRFGHQLGLGSMFGEIQGTDMAILYTIHHYAHSRPSFRVLFSDIQRTGPAISDVAVCHASHQSRRSCSSRPGVGLMWNLRSWILCW
jgi:hypothetical protein